MVKPKRVNAWQCPICPEFGIDKQKMISHCKIPHKGRKLPRGLVYESIDRPYKKRVYTLVVDYHYDTSHFLHNDEVRFYPGGSCGTDIVITDLRKDLAEVVASILDKKEFQDFVREHQSLLGHYGFKRFVRVPPKIREAFSAR